MKQQHSKVSDTGKAENLMKTAILRHSAKHEKKDPKGQKVDLLPLHKKKS